MYPFQEKNRELDGHKRSLKFSRLPPIEIKGAEDSFKEFITRTFNIFLFTGKKLDLKSLNRKLDFRLCNLVFIQVKKNLQKGKYFCTEEVLPTLGKRCGAAAHVRKANYHLNFDINPISTRLLGAP